MRITITEHFEKAIDKLKNKQVQERVLEVINHVQAANTMQDIRSLEKLTGFKEYFRIRIGDYRIGIKIIDNEIFFLDVGHRKEIYNRFP